MVMEFGDQLQLEGTLMKENTSKTKSMVLEFTSGQMDPSMKVHLKMIWSMVKERSRMRTVKWHICVGKMARLWKRLKCQVGFIHLQKIKKQLKYLKTLQNAISSKEDPLKNFKVPNRLIVWEKDVFLAAYPLNQSSNQSKKPSIKLNMNLNTILDGQFSTKTDTKHQKSTESRAMDSQL